MAQRICAFTGQRSGCERCETHPCAQALHSTQQTSRALRTLVLLGPVLTKELPLSGTIVLHSHVEARGSVKEGPDSDESEEESQESSHHQCLAAKSDPARRPPEPALPPRGHRKEEEGRHRERGAEERAPPTSGKKRKKRDNRGSRVAKKHQRLHRALEDPSVRLHRRPPGHFWDTSDRVSSRDQHQPRRHGWRSIYLWELQDGRMGCFDFGKGTGDRGRSGRLRKFRRRLCVGWIFGAKGRADRDGRDGCHGTKPGKRRSSGDQKNVASLQQENGGDTSLLNFMRWRRHLRPAHRQFQKVRPGKLSVQLHHRPCQTYDKEVGEGGHSGGGRWQWQHRPDGARPLRWQCAGRRGVPPQGCQATGDPKVAAAGKAAPRRRVAEKEETRLAAKEIDRAKLRERLARAKERITGAATPGGAGTPALPPQKFVSVILGSWYPQKWCTSVPDLSSVSALVTKNLSKTQWPKDDKAVKAVEKEALGLRMAQRSFLFTCWNARRKRPVRMSRLLKSWLAGKKHHEMPEEYHKYKGHCVSRW